MACSSRSEHNRRPERTGRPSKTDRKSTRLNSSHGSISYAVFCLKKKNKAEDTAMQLLECGLLRLAEVLVTDDANMAFTGGNWALVVGAAPRGLRVDSKGPHRGIG